MVAIINFFFRRIRQLPQSSNKYTCQSLATYRSGPVLSEYNIRLPEGTISLGQLKDWIRAVFRDQNRAFYLNLQFGFLLMNPIEIANRRMGLETEGEGDGEPDPPYAYFYGSTNTRFYLDSPLITDSSKLDEALAKLDETDLTEWATNLRQSSKWALLGFTNVTVRLVKFRNHPCRGAPILPEYLRRNPNLMGLTNNPHTGRQYNDDMCFFRSLALQRGFSVRNCEQEAKRLMLQWCEHIGILPDDFDGLTFEDLEKAEQLFNVRVNVWEQVYLENDQHQDADETRGDDIAGDFFMPAARTADDGDLNEEAVEREERSGHIDRWFGVLARRTGILDTTIPEMNLNLFENHFSYIHNIEGYCRTLICEKCNRVFDHRGHYNCHVERCSGSVSKSVFPGGGFSLPNSVFTQMSDIGVHVAPDRQYRDMFAVFDYESRNIPTDQNVSAKVTHTAKLEPASVSVCTSVPDYCSPKNFISDGNPAHLTKSMIEYLEAVQRRVSQWNRERYADVLGLLAEAIENKRRKTYSSTGLAYHVHHKQLIQMQEISEKFNEWLDLLPVFSFNGGKFDLNLIRQHLFPDLVREKKMRRGTIKRGNGYLTLRLQNIQFLDVSNFLAAGTSYALMLTSFKVAHGKFYWPYDWFVSLDQLNQTELPPKEAFFSKLKNKGITDEEYQHIKDVWHEKGWTCMRDMLAYYNNLDVGPFVEAVQKMCSWWRSVGIDMLTQALSLPTLALRHLFNNISHGYYFPLINENNADWFWSMKEQIVGGPSMVYHRHHEKGRTKIRNGSRLCRQILGLDCNALYLWCIMQELPVNVYYRWKRGEDQRFHRRNIYPYSSKEIQWITWTSWLHGVGIKHQFNGGQVDLGTGLKEGQFKRLPVDGFCPATNTIYQFHGCYFHGHGAGANCPLVNGDPLGKHEETQAITRHLRSLGYNVEEIYECQFDQLMRSETCSLKKYVSERYSCFGDDRSCMSEQELLAGVTSGKFFGMLEVDITVPENLKEKFAELQPIFKNVHISKDDLSPFMRDYAERHGMMKSGTRRTLIGSYFGDRILLITPLLKWYIEHGLEVTKVHQAYEAHRSPQFASLGETICQARRDADADPAQKMRGEMSKTTGNCFYGKTVTDVTKHCSVEYANGRGIDKFLRSPYFRDLTEIGPDTYEVLMRKKRHIFNLPSIIGFFVYQYAKLRMLAFYYDFLDVYIPRDCFQLCQMDTDSFYMAISGSSLDDMVPADQRDQFMSIRHHWLPRNDTPENEAHDKRKPGLFKGSLIFIATVVNSACSTDSLKEI